MSTALRVLICAAALAYVFSQLEWERFKDVVRQGRWEWLLASVAALAPIPFLLALRLKWLMNANDIPLRFGRAVSVTLAGNFASFVLPGQTGGDVIKAVLVTRDTHRRHEAATIVFFDRVLGLLCVVVLSGAMLLANWRDPAVRRWGRPIGMVFVSILVPAALYFSESFRRLIRWERIVDQLPLSRHLRRIDAAVLAYRNKRRCVVRCMVLTWLLQGISILATSLAGRAVGMVGPSALHTLQIYLVYVPLCWMAGALPITPQGLGVLEWAYTELIHRAAGFGTAEGATMLSMLTRLTNLVWALPGVAVFLRSRRAAVADAALDAPAPQSLP